MKLDFESLCAANGIYVAQPGDRHYHPGDWVQVECPFCSGNPGHHLGWNKGEGFFHCFRCKGVGGTGWHAVDKAVAALLRIALPEARRIIKQFSASGTVVDEPSEPAPRREVKSSVRMPPGCGPMTKLHREYLSGRGFDPDRLEAEWGLLGTGMHGEYKFRVVAPITFCGRVVSYQARDVTGKSNLRYKACRIEDEVVHHKHVLYGFDEAVGLNEVTVVEGIPNVWRLGRGSVATFGISYTDEQVDLLVRHWKRIRILFDRDEHGAGQEAAENLGGLLSSRGRDVEILVLEESDLPPGGKDVGDIPESRIREIPGLRPASTHPEKRTQTALERV